MTWIKVDDQFHAHPKVVHAWHADPRAVGLHAMALSHCAAYLTDGHVSEVWVRTQIPGAAQRRRTVGALTDAGLWEQNGTGWIVHDYLHFNESRDEVLKRRAEQAEQRSEAGRNGARKRWRPGSSPYGEQAKNGSSPYGEQIAPARPAPDLFPQLASS